MEICPLCALYKDINLLDDDEITTLTRVEKRCRCGAVLFVKEGRTYVCRELRTTIYGADGKPYVSKTLVCGGIPAEREKKLYFPMGG